MLRVSFAHLLTIEPETPDPEPHMTPETNEPAASPYRVDWSDATVERELAAACKKGYLVLPTSRVEEVEVCNLAFEPAGRIDLPDCGHVIVRLKNPADCATPA